MNIPLRRSILHTAVLLPTLLAAQAGVIDPTFNAGTAANGIIDPLMVQQDNKLLVGGAFTMFNGTARNRIARLEPDGALDTSFDPGTGANNTVNAIAIQPDGKVLIGGAFTSVNGTLISRIARLNTNGSFDGSLSVGTGANNQVLAIAVQSDGKILIAGSFTSFNGVARGRIARLNSDGTLDASFVSGTMANGSVYDIKPRSDGRVMIAGGFTQYNGVTRVGIARLNSDGTLDTGFDPGTGVGGGPPQHVRKLSLLADGRVLIGGYFTSYNGVSRTKLARVNADGSLDVTFDAGTTAAGGSDVIGVDVMANGQCVFGGAITGSVFRLNTAGNIDNSFGIGSGANNQVNNVHVLPNGLVLVTGHFSSYNGVAQGGITRLTNPSRIEARLMLEGPYNVGSMNDALRDLPSFPLTEPFSAMGYSNAAYIPGATISSNVLSATGDNAVVDWVIMEMRPVATPDVIAASRAVLLQRDGDVVDLDGTSTVGFAGLAAGNYCVAVKPRNHLPVMLSATTPVSYGAAIATVDFNLPTTQVYDNDARKNVSGVMVLAAGDVSFNETVGYTGSGNDRDPILTRVGSTTPNATVAGYWREDVNMDGVVKYTGSGNDRDIILTNVGSTTPNNTRVATLP